MSARVGDGSDVMPARDAAVGVNAPVRASKGSGMSSHSAGRSAASRLLSLAIAASTDHGPRPERGAQRLVGAERPQLHGRGCRAENVRRFLHAEPFVAQKHEGFTLRRRQLRKYTLYDERHFARNGRLLGIGFGTGQWLVRAGRIRVGMRAALAFSLALHTHV